ncbi:MAG: DUF177 domain-containing protein [Rhizobiaceae bacterium]|nr:DUF177 domain-containing protein [Rhizobiaceae bacterium]
MKRQDEVERSPISYVVNVARLPQRGMSVRIEADDEQRRELAETHGLEQVDSLVANLMVTPWKRNGVKVAGVVEASVVQSCIVTLEPVANKVREEIETVFLPQQSKLGREGFGLGGEIVLDPEGPDSPEVFSGDTIDVGALAEEYFGLGIDPYPRKRDADAAGDLLQPEGENAEGSAFADKLRAALSKK